MLDAAESLAASPPEPRARFKLQDVAVQSALCAGIVAALVWGVGLALYGLHERVEEISWLAGSAQLIGGIFVCLLVPPAYLKRQWVLEHIQPPRGPL